MEDYKEKYEQALEKAKFLKENTDGVGAKDVSRCFELIFPELKESDDEKKPNGGIVSENFNEGEGFYKVNLAYLNKKQVIEIEELVKKWNPELKEGEDERIKKEIIQFLQLPHPQFVGKRSHEEWIAWLKKQGEPIDEEELLIGARKRIALSIMDFLDMNTLGMCLSSLECKGLEDAVVGSDWRAVYNYMKKKLEKQDEQPNKVSIWKHWNNGSIGGNGDGELIYLIKSGNTFILSSCLCFECDYIELSELDKLYVEQQGEQKPADKGEPKFKVGDIIKHNKANIICKVISVNSGSYYVENIKSGGRVELFNVEHDFHLWTINDAKDGDVLYYKSPLTGIEYIVMNRGINCYGNIDSYFRFHSEDGFDINVPSVFSAKLNEITPATIEQCDLLFQQMKEAGYEWDNEKRELKEIKHKFVNEVELKFKIGDWVVFKNRHQSIYQVEKIEDGYYILRHTHGGTYRVCVLHDEDLRLWTIKDAIDGDILATHMSPEGDWIGIYKQSTDDVFKTHCFLNTVGEFVINPNRCKNHGTHGLHPATKEQRDLLFRKMKEAGYEWDAEKKELRNMLCNDTER